MKTSEKSTKRKCVEEMAVVAGSLAAVGAMQADAEASVITVTGSPVSLALSTSNGTTTTWDVDGVNGDDFRLRKFKSSTYTRGSTYNYHFVSVQSNGLNGRGFVGAAAPGDNVNVLSQSFNVGPTLNSFAWGVGAFAARVGMSSTPSQFGMPDLQDIGDAFPDAVEGDNFIGFRFLSSGNLHYGYANINFDTSNGIVSITEWAYEDTPNTAIHTAVVPEPSSLALLAMGAGGLLAYRARKKKKSTVSKDGAA